jgi:putative IMPACT (imprinted ancient) family translation regulator
VVVTRYFGGIKLGAGGLIRAYAGAAEAVLTELPRRIDPPRHRRLLRMGFADEQPLRHWLSGVEGATLESLDYGEGVSAVVILPEAVLEAFEAWCGALGVHCRSTGDESCIEPSERP